jgi:hypothetical protein
MVPRPGWGGCGFLSRLASELSTAGRSAADGSPALGGEDGGWLSRAQAGYPQARRFWSTVGDTTPTTGPTANRGVDGPDGEPPDGIFDVDTLRGIGLARGVILLVEGGSRASEADLAAVRAAAGPLIATVQRLGLGRAAAAPPTDSREGDDR